MKHNRSLEQQLRAGMSFIVPCTFLGDRAAAVEAIIGRPLRPLIVSVAGYDIKAVVIPGRVRGAKIYPRLFDAELFRTAPFGQVLKLVFFEARTGQRLLPLITSDTAQLKIYTDVLLGDEVQGPEERRLENVTRMYQPHLEELARLTGWQIHFHANAPMCLPPFSDEGETLHLLPGSVPPGQRGVQWLSHAFGLRIQNDMSAVNGQEPTRGRGIVIHDSDDRPVVQLVNRTAYILFPILSTYHGKESLEIFRQTLQAIWNRLRQEPDARANDRDRMQRQGRKAFVAALTAQAEEMPRHWGKRIARLEAEIAAAQEKLRLLYLGRNDTLAIAEASKNGGLFVRTVARLPHDYKRIASHRDVDGVYVRDGGIHVETRTITAVYEGKRYLLGRYIMRIGNAGEVSVWGIETRHPKGTPHPHLPRSGIACFGTATDTIMRAAGELRYADCVLYVLRWLTEGYSPESADAKIEEWPLEPQSPT